MVPRAAAMAESVWAECSRPTTMATAFWDQGGRDGGVHLDRVAVGQQGAVRVVVGGRLRGGDGRSHLR